MKYRKKPVVIEAYQTDVEMDIETLEGVMHADVGDFIITGVKGEQYPCKPDIFLETYEIAEPQEKGCFNCRYEERDERCIPCSEGYNWYWEPQTEKCDRPQMDCSLCWKESHCKAIKEAEKEGDR